MAKPVNAMTGDAPDGQNPDKKYVPEKTGRFKYTPPPPPKPDPRDAEIFTEEKLRRSGGKMKEPPMGLDSKKHGGSIKARRFAIGGEMMDEYNGAMGRGTDTPDKKIAREKSDAAYESDAADKAAGLKASKNDEPVGFFKRLMMGNIDKPGSEAYEKFGAGRGRTDAAREDANKSTRNERESARTREANMALDDNTPAPVKTKPSVDNNPIATGYTNRLEKEERNAETELTSAERANAMRPNRVAATVKPTVKPSISASDKPNPPVGGMRKNTDMAEGPTFNSTRTGPEKKTTAVREDTPEEKRQQEAWEDYKRISKPGKDAIEGVYPEQFLIPGGKAIASGAMGVKAYKAAQLAKDAAAARRFSETAAPQVAKDISKYTPKQELEAGTSAIRGSVTRKGIREERSRAEAGAPKGTSFMEKAASNKRGTSYKDDMKKGGSIKAYASGGSVSASSRGDGCAQRGKTRGTMR